MGNLELSEESQLIQHFLALDFADQADYVADLLQRKDFEEFRALCSLPDFRRWRGRRRLNVMEGKRFL